MNLAASNINQLWANLLVEELIRSGVQYFCIAPGSRSAPLTVAVAENKKAKEFIHFDERALGFHALGYASAKREPVAIITTSGSAVANLFPAVVEASKKKIPLIILSADRPPELRFTGANQTIDQVKMFGGYVRWQMDMPTPTTDIDPAFVLTTADQAVAQAKSYPNGPVHLNCMFREPLAPVKAGVSLTKYKKDLKGWVTQKTPRTVYTEFKGEMAPTDLNKAIDQIKKIKSGIIAVGKLSNEEQKAAVLKLAQQLKMPIWPDLTSGLRLGNNNVQTIHYFDQMLLSKDFVNRIEVDGVIQIGGRMTSKRFEQFIQQKSLKSYIMLLNHPLRNDPHHKVQLRIQGDLTSNLKQLTKRVVKRSPLSDENKQKSDSNRIHKYLNEFIDKEPRISEPSTARLISEHIPQQHALFVSSSLPIREMDMYASANKASVDIGSNRGASGIDGTVASAVGYSLGLNKRTTLLIGDLALLYDLNALSMIPSMKFPMTIIVINNNGGGIFSFLPIAKFEKVLTPYFNTPHGLNFSKAAEMFQLSYEHPKTNKEFVKVYKGALVQKNSTLIEVTIDRAQNVRLQNKIQKDMMNILKVR